MIQKGQFVTVHYTGKLSDGEIFDSTEGRDPFEFEIGCGFVIPAFEDTIAKMKINDETDLFVKASDAYGDYRDDLIQRVPIAEVSQYLTPEKGTLIQVMLSEGQHAPALIKDVTDSEVVLDFNHPLAGQDLSFKLKLMGITDEPTQESECDDEDCESCGSGCGCNG
jgi:FKBP-type peptidyl-prolyl cis-trans isomerase 2